MIITAIIHQQINIKSILGSDEDIQLQRIKYHANQVVPLDDVENST